MSQPIILAIDTSCDETCAAVSCGRKILSNVISSQINIHAKWGGVVPHLAKRAHLEKIEPVVREALLRSQRSVLAERQGRTLKDSSPYSDSKKKTPGQFETFNGNTPGVKPACAGREVPTPGVKFINAIAVTIGPGLAPALEVGIAYAKKLSLEHHKPLIAINHMEGHLLSSLALPNTPTPNTPGVKPACAGREVPTPGVKLIFPAIGSPLFPAIGLLVSGGHTQLILVKKIGDYQLLGETLDDAGGEALDKLAKMLKLGYPGGPIIEELAKKGNPNAIKLPIPIRYSKDFNFSFSGLKTAALYKIQDRFGTSKSNGSELSAVCNEVKDSSEPSPSKKFTHNMAAAFQQAIAISLTTKLTRAIKEYNPESILLGGGVFSNLYIRNQVRKTVKSFNLLLHCPYSKKLYTDNAAMIAIAASFKFYKGSTFVKNLDKLDRIPNLNF